METEGWRESEAARAVMSFMTVTISILMNMMSSLLTGRLNKAGVEMAKKRVAEAVGKAGLAQFFNLDDPQRGDALQKAMFVLSVLSTLEAFIEDLTKAVLKENKKLLQEKQFSRLRLTAAQAFGEEDDRIHFVYIAIKDAVGLAPGINRYENILKYVGLDGAVPPEISDAIHEAQAVRNVWAHSAGSADRHFIERVPHLRWKRGDLVAISQEETEHFVTSVMLYGMIVSNRHLDSHGLKPVNIDYKTDKVPLVETFNTFYATEHSEPGTSASTSSAPPESPAPPSAEAPQAGTSSTD